ncbi:hypothetical protein CYMTET_25685 [Cymbomonas tetramitiformis]|uniref:Uncharacterized protein n=1 Tax=Cymbomonas tetramitiformis TaxID=36881 RepID=A0AAE0FTP9_9CHLO|nr:hypothetical protein CYMTET_25685 [Cymbomonas tetramitiformis]
MDAADAVDECNALYGKPDIVTDAFFFTFVEEEEERSGSVVSWIRLRPQNGFASVLDDDFSKERGTTSAPCAVVLLPNGPTATAS